MNIKINNNFNIKENITESNNSSDKVLKNNFFKKEKTSVQKKKTYLSKISKKPKKDKNQEPNSNTTELRSAASTSLIKNNEGDNSITRNTEDQANNTIINQKFYNTFNYKINNEVTSKYYIYTSIGDRIMDKINKNNYTYKKAKSKEALQLSTPRITNNSSLKIKSDINYTDSGITANPATKTINSPYFLNLVTPRMIISNTLR